MQDDNVKILLSFDLRELRSKVTEKDLDWFIVDNGLAIESKKENILFNVDKDIELG